MAHTMIKQVPKVIEVTEEEVTEVAEEEEVTEVTPAVTEVTPVVTEEEVTEEVTSSDAEVTDVEDVTKEQTTEQTEKEKFKEALQKAMGSFHDEAFYKGMIKALKNSTDAALKAEKEKETTRKFATVAAGKHRFREFLKYTRAQKEALRKKEELYRDYNAANIATMATQWEEVLQANPHLTETKVLTTMSKMVKNKECVLKPKSKKRSRSGSE